MTKLGGRYLMKKVKKHKFLACIIMIFIIVIFGYKGKCFADGGQYARNGCENTNALFVRRERY